MEGSVELILIVVTLAAAILGTITNQTDRVKIAIISLAVLTSVGTAIKAYLTSQENEVNKKLIVTLVQASSKPEYFSHDLVKSLRPILKKDQRYVAGQQVFEDSEERILTLKNLGSSSEDISGLIYISKKAMNPIYYAYALEDDMSKPLGSLLNNSWTDCREHWNECLNEFSAIAREALEVAPIQVSETTSSMNDSPLRFEIETLEDYQGNKFRIVFEESFIESLYGIAPADRGLRILEEGQTYVIGQL